MPIRHDLLNRWPFLARHAVIFCGKDAALGADGDGHTSTASGTRQWSDLSHVQVSAVVGPRRIAAGHHAAKIFRADFACDRHVLSDQKSSLVNCHGTVMM